MPVSPADFALWARATGNKYPETAEEKLAAAPHAYEYARNLGKSGQNAPGSRVGGTILFHQPESVQNQGANAVFDAPVTPDNDARKVAGTLDNTLTSQHFVNQESHEAEDNNRQRNLVDIIGKTALAAGTLAAGVTLARNPSVQQAVRSAGTTLNENAQNIGGRVSSFLRGFGGGQTTDPAVVRNSGDVTPPTTAQQYNQPNVPIATQEIQVAKPVSTGSVDPWTGQPTVTKSVSDRTENFLKNVGVAPVNQSTGQVVDPWTESSAPTQSAIISTTQSFSPNNQTEPTRTQLIKQALATAKTSGATGEYVPDIPNPYDIYGPEYKRTFGTAPQELQVARRAISRGEANPLAGAPLVDPITGEIRNAALSVPGAEAVLNPSEQTSQLQGSSVGQQVEDFLATGRTQNFPTTALTTRTGLMLNPVRHQEIERPITPGINRVVGQTGPLPSTVQVERPFYSPGDVLTPSGFVIPGGRDVVSEPAKKLQVQRLAGARDVEAALATQEAMGVNPMGPFSSTLTQETYRPAYEAVSGIDPVLKVGTLAERLAKAGGYLGGNKKWIDAHAAAIEANRAAEAGKGMESIRQLRQSLSVPGQPEEQQAVNQRVEKFLNQATNLYNITEDPAVLQAAGQVALPIQVTLPGGETVPTKAFYKPFGVVGAGPGTEQTQAQMLENRLLGAQTVHSNVKAIALNELGLDPKTLSLTGQQYAALSPATRNQLRRSHEQVQSLSQALQSANENPYLYSIPENITRGTKLVPVMSQSMNDIANQVEPILVGQKLVPEETTMTPLQRLIYEANKGVGRQDVGGVGRRREELSSTYGFDPFGKAGRSSLLPDADPGSVSSVMYVLAKPHAAFEGASVGDLVPAESVLPEHIASKAVRPITGQAVTAQRLLGAPDRPYRGIEPSVVTTASFDPEMRAQLLAANPSLETPEGLVYATEATLPPTAAGKQAKEILGWEQEQAAERKTGRRNLSVFTGKLKQIAASKKAVPGSEQGAHLASLTDDQLNETIMQAQFAGMPDVAEAASKVLNARSSVKEGAKSVALQEQARRGIMLEKPSGLGKPALNVLEELNPVSEQSTLVVNAEPKQVISTVEQPLTTAQANVNLAYARKQYNTTRKLALSQLGLTHLTWQPEVPDLTNEQFKALPFKTQQQLYSAHQNLQAAEQVAQTTAQNKVQEVIRQSRLNALIDKYSKTSS